MSAGLRAFEGTRRAADLIEAAMAGPVDDCHDLTRSHDSATIFWL